MGLRSRLEALDRAGTPMRVGLVGAGQMGRGFIAQVTGIPGMETVAVADVDPRRGLEAFREVGLDPVEGLNGHPGRRKCRTSTSPGIWRRTACWSSRNASKERCSPPLR